MNDPDPHTRIMSLLSYIAACRSSLRPIQEWRMGCEKLAAMLLLLAYTHARTSTLLYTHTYTHAHAQTLPLHILDVLLNMFRVILRRCGIHGKRQEMGGEFDGEDWRGGVRMRF